MKIEEMYFGPMHIHIFTTVSMNHYVRPYVQQISITFSNI